ncbi:hypothetical protein ADJ73_04060 [Arsenicicoccus sp. oral taxon 190]|nr:hypothetical protein ADJ73_04060 [Arsenicicoccus sp. oral taxon 190]
MGSASLASPLVTQDERSARGPHPESIADRLVAALDEAAEREPDPERKGWLRKTAAYLGNAGRDLAVEIGATAINRQMGM